MSSVHDDTHLFRTRTSLEVSNQLLSPFLVKNGSGANLWNHADTDAGYGLGSLWDRLTIGRE